MTDTTQATGDNTQAAEGTQNTDTTAPASTAPNTDATAAAAAASTEKPAGTEAPAEIVYDFKAPEGVTLDKAMTEEFTALAKEMKIAPADAQKFVDLQVKAQQAAVEAHLSTVKEWRDSVVNDKELGGDKLAENISTAKKALSLGPPELNDLLKQTGMDNHPAVFKWCLAVGKALSEDRMVQGGTAVSTNKSTASVLYPSNA